MSVSDTARMSRSLTYPPLRCLLRKCYFHPSRDKSFPSPEIKRMAHTAMLLLWEKISVRLFGKTYRRKQIRQVILGRMMPEHLDQAVNFFIHSQDLTTADHLAELIFAFALHGDTLTEILFDRDFGGAA